MNDLQSYFRNLHLDRDVEVETPSRVSRSSPEPLIHFFARSSTSPALLPDAPAAAEGGDAPSSTTLPVFQLGEALSCSSANASTGSYLGSSPHVVLLGCHQIGHLRGRNVLVLDLDETLVYSSHNKLNFNPEVDKVVSVRVDVPNPPGALDSSGSLVHYVARETFVKVRPHAELFLREVSAHFEVVIFTAGINEYARAIMKLLDPNKDYYHHILSREHCTVIDDAYVKDLSTLGRPLNKVIIVDNSPVAYVLQPRNAIPCTSWFNDTSDVELLEILQLLLHCAACSDVYTILDPYHQLLERYYFAEDGSPKVS